MNENLPAAIVAIVTTNSNRIQGGGVPIFVVDNEESLRTESSALENILDTSAHEINAQTMILVSH